MPLLRKQVFKPNLPPKDLRPDDEVFFCEATKEVFKDYDLFFQRTILCNSLVWSCSISGKGGLTYEEAVDSERKVKKRLGTIPKPLRKGLMWLSSRTKRGRLSDLVDDVYVYSYNRFFKGEIVEGVIKEQWCDVKILKVIPPTQEEIAKDAQEEAEELEREKIEREKEGLSPKPKPKEKKSFSPPDHLIKYEVEEVEPDDPEIHEVHVLDADDLRREKGTYTREKNLLFLKNIVELAHDGNFHLKKNVSEELKAADIKFTDIFDGPEPIFEESKRVKGIGSLHSSKSKHSSDHKKKGKSNNHKGQGTLDSWVKGGKASSQNEKPKPKKLTPEENEAEIKRIQQQNQKFKDEMRMRMEEAKKRRLEEKNREKERKKEERKLLNQLKNEWKKKRDDLECDDLKELPQANPIHCKIPNKLFGEFLTLLEFFHAFSEVLDSENTFTNGLNFETLQEALTEQSGVSSSLYDVLNCLLTTLFDLQDEEDEEVKLDRLTANVENLDKNILGKDEDVANYIKSATVMVQWPMKTQGQKLRELHMDQWSITEILRLHLEAAGAFRSDKLNMWLYQQRGGYKLSDDPGLHFRMEEPQILETLNTRTVFDLNVHERIKILNVLMYQILSFASVRDVIDDRFNDYAEAKSELRNHLIAENKKHRAFEEAEKAKRREEKVKKDEVTTNKEEEKKSMEELQHLTERQRLAILSQKEKEEKKKQKDEEMRRSEALELEAEMIAKVSKLQTQCGITFLGRDRAYRRFWVLNSLPGLFVEHDDDTVGPCLSEQTPYNPQSGPMDENTAMQKVQDILNSRVKSPDEKSSSDKENDQNDGHKLTDVSKTYSKKKEGSAPLKQKVLSTKNGSLASTSAQSGSKEIEVIELDSQIEEEKPEVKEETKTIHSLPWGACLADPEACPVHSTILPKTYWSYFNTTSDVDILIDSLNERGFRESELKDKLVTERDRIAKNFKKFSSNLIHNLTSLSDIKDDKDKQMEIEHSDDNNVSSIMELTLRDQILELEEKIYIGTLGTLKVRNRETWRNALQFGGYDKQSDALSWGGMSSISTPFESRAHSTVGSRDTSPPSSPGNKRDSTGSTAARDRRKKVNDLACAVLQIAQMIEEKNIKLPLGEDEKEKKKRLKEEEKRRKEREEEDSDGVTDASRDFIKTPFQEWESSLMNSTSFGQVYLHLNTLENSISWSKSLLNLKCRICRRKTEGELMIMCDGCDRGHHTFCLKPKLKSVPEGDWFCSSCKPKERVRTPKKKSRRVFSTAEEEEEDEDTTQSEASDVSESENESGEEGSEEEQEEENVEEMEEEEDFERFDDDDEVPLKRKKKKRSVEPAPKKAKKSSKTQISNETSVSIPKISQLFGRRRCAAEANKKIARVSQEIHSGNSSGNDSGSESKSNHNTRTTRKTAKRSLEVPTSTNNLSSARSKRRRAIDDEIEGIFNPTVLEDLLNAMIRHKDGWPFGKPITKADAPDYHKIVKKPMDLGTIRSSILRMKYTCNQEVMEDILLVFKNCALYNREDAEEYICGVKLEKYFRREAKKLGLMNDDDTVAPKNKTKKSRRTC